MNAAIDAALARLACGFPEPLIGTFGAREAIRTDGEFYLVGADYPPQYCCRRTRECAMTGCIRRKRWRIQQRRPITHSPRIREPDRRDGSPKFVAVLAFPAKDGGVGQSDVQQGE